MVGVPSVGDLSSAGGSAGVGCAVAGVVLAGGDGGGRRWVAADVVRGREDLAFGRGGQGLSEVAPPGISVGGRSASSPISRAVKRLPTTAAPTEAPIWRK